VPPSDNLRLSGFALSENLISFVFYVQQGDTDCRPTLIFIIRIADPRLEKTNPGIIITKRLIQKFHEKMFHRNNAVISNILI
jgi:hypothetical protein